MRGFAKIFFMLCVMFIALSCVDAVEGLDVSEGEICMSPVLSDMTKTRAGGDTNPYPDGSSFGAFAFYSETEAGQPWYGTPQKYFENHEFRSDAGVCSGVDPVYWPLSGSLIFAGYSPYEAGANTAFDPATKTLTINDYTVDRTTDLMYFLPELSDGNYVGYDKSTASVPVKFYHALSCVSINVAVKSGDENVKLKSITLKDVYTQGNFTVNASDPTSGTWGGLTAKKDISLHSSDTDDGTDLSPALDLKCFTIPGSASAIEIVYLDRGVEKPHSITPAEHIAVWDQGLRYQYNITLSVGLEPVVLNDAIFSISHNYPGGILTGSQLNVDLRLSDEDRQRMKNVTITVKKDGDVYKTQTFDKLSRNDFVITEGPKLYLPISSGPYTVVCTYDDGTSEPGSREFTVYPKEEPEFSCHISYVTLLNQLRIREAYVTISDDVLKEVKMTFELLIHHGGPLDVQEKADYDSSCFMKERTIGLSSSDSYNFGQTNLMFDGIAIFPNYNGKKDRKFEVPSSYSIGERVELASNLEPNVKYALSLNKDYYASPRPYWSSYPGYLAYQSFFSRTNDSVFLYERDDSQKHTKANEYNYSSAGAWISAYDFKYVDANFWFSTTPTYFTCASVWGSQSYDDNKLIVDIYCNSESAFINRNDSGFSWNITGETSYKWNVYKVNHEY